MVCGFLAAIPPKVWIALCITGALVASHWYTYSTAQEKTEKRIHAEYKPKIQVLTDKIKGFEDAIVKQTKNAKEAKELQDREQAKVKKELEDKYEKSQRENRYLRSLTKRAPDYVTQHADRQCIITSGFVRLYNEAATSTETDLGIPGGPPVDVDAATTLKLSEVAAVTVENFTECRERGRVIDAWQSWYASSKVIFDKAQEIASGKPQ